MRRGRVHPFIFNQSFIKERRNCFLVSTKSSTHTNKEKKDDGRVHTYKHVTHILLFLRSLFFSRSRRCKDEEMNNRFSLQREEIQLKTDGLPTLRETENSKTKTKKTFIVEKNTSAFFRGETTKKHERARKSAFTRLQNRATTRTTRAREREKRETKRIERTKILLKNDDDDDDDIARAPALASFCATNNPSNGPFRCHWRTLARFSIASSAASSNRKRQYACGLIDRSIV